MSVHWHNHAGPRLARDARLETERLILRRPDGRDAGAAVAFFASDRAAHVGGPYPEGRGWRHFAAEIGHWDLLGYGMWAVTTKSSGETVGLVGPWCPPDWPETEIGWLIFEGAEGQGYAREAARAALGHAFTVLGWTTAVSYVAPDNHRSAALARRLGAVLDSRAPQPKPADPQHVYRHPRPEARP